ncbi:MAG: hypothetical protein QXP53_02025 [Candidatus Pacearchaeota archaeon]
MKKEIKISTPMPSISEKDKSFKATFWMFVVIAVALGFLLAFTITTSNLIKDTQTKVESISGKALFSFLGGEKTSETEETGTTDINEICEKISQEQGITVEECIANYEKSKAEFDMVSNITYNCTRYETIQLQDLHDPMLLVAYKDFRTRDIVCSKAQYTEGYKQVVVTYYGNRFDRNRGKIVARLSFDCYINGSIYNHHDEEMSVDDIGFFGEALKIHTYIATGNVSRLLFVIPKTYIDFCNAGMEPWQHDQWGGLYGTNGGGGGGGGNPSGPCDFAGTTFSYGDILECYNLCMGHCGWWCQYNAVPNHPCSRLYYACFYTGDCVCACREP